jgi:hypothetical protein
MKTRGQSSAIFFIQPLKMENEEVAKETGLHGDCGIMTAAVA